MCAESPAVDKLTLDIPDGEFRDDRAASGSDHERTGCHRERAPVPAPTALFLPRKEPCGARRHGHSAPVVHGLQVRAFTAPGATLFPHSIGEVFVSFLELSCSFLGEVHSGDTLYPALTITALEPQGETGVVVTAATIHNQRGNLVLSGQHKYLLRR